MSGKLIAFALTLAGGAFLIYATQRDERVKQEYNALLNRIRQGIKTQ